MLRIARKRFEELLEQIEALNEKSPIPGLPPVNYTPMVQQAIDKISEQLKTYIFASDEEEARFFKEGLPALLSLACYESEKFKLAYRGFSGSGQVLKRYVELLICEIREFFETHIEFIRYCLAGESSRDQEYFLRRSEANRKTTDLLTILVDPQVSTVHSVRAGTMVAYLWLLRDLSLLIFGKPEAESPPAVQSGTLQWTDSNAALVELIYALYANGCFNHGTATIRQITDFVEKALNVQLGNVYRVRQDLLSRKMGITAFLDRLKKGLDELGYGE